MVRRNRPAAKGGEKAGFNLNPAISGLAKESGSGIGVCGVAVARGSVAGGGSGAC